MQPQRPETILVTMLAAARAQYQVRDFDTVQRHLDEILSTAAPEGHEPRQHRDLLAGARALYAQLLFDEGRIPEARDHAEMAAVLLQGTVPQASRPSADLGIALFLLDRRAEALPYLEHAILMGLPAWDAARWLGLARKDDQDWNAAEPLLNLATTCLPGFGSVRLAWAEVLEKLNRRAAAIEQFRESGIAFQAEDAESAERAFRRALALDPGDVQTLYLLGDLARLQDRLPEAEAVLLQVLDVQPEHPFALASLAALRAAEERKPEALALMDRAVRAAPRDEGIRMLQLDVLEFLHERRALLKAVDEARSVVSDQRPLLERKASTEIALGKWRAAQQTTTVALRAYPDSLRLMTLHVEALLGGHSGNEALTVLQAALLGKPDDPDLMMLQAEVLSRLSEPEAAIRVLDAVLARHPDHVGALLKKGEYLVTFDPVQAEQLLTKALAQTPESFEAHFNLGEAKRRLGQFDAALPLVKHALDLQPDDAVVRATMGQILMGLGRLDEARESLDRALAADPSLEWGWTTLDEVCRRLNQPDHFREQVIGALQAHSEEPRVLVVIGQAVALIPDNALAEETLRKAIDLDSSIVEAHSVLATVLRLSGKNDAALSAYDTALALQPANPAAIIGKAWLALDYFKNPESAIELLQPFAELSVADPVLIAQYGEALRRTERWDKADAALERAYRLAPDNAWIAGSRGLVLTDIGRFEDATSAAERSARLNPSAWAFGVLGWAWENVGRGDGKKAEAAYAAGLAEDSGDPWCRKGVGNAYRLQGRAEEANQCYQEVVDRASREVARASEYGLSLLGWCEYQLGDFTEAIRLFSSAIAADPHSISDHFDLGLSLFGAGNDASATMMYDAGFELIDRLDHAGRKKAVLHIAYNDLLEGVDRRIVVDRVRSNAAGVLDAIDKRLKAATPIPQG